MSLYLWLDLLSISVPLLCSFHPKIKLHKHFHWIFLAIGLSMIPYIIWDIYFTYSGYWGFNIEYLSGLHLFKLPIEEWLFFVCIPFACMFTHFSLRVINPNMELSEKVTKYIVFTLLLSFAIVGVFNFDKAYTLVDMLFVLIVLAVVYKYKFKLLQSYFLTFLIMLIPFLIVNGVLTGSFIEGEVVWYSDNENLGLRIFTIPVEDSVYAFSMILLNLFLFEQLSGYMSPRQNKVAGIMGK